jgi:hypothetical protein
MEINFALIAKGLSPLITPASRRIGRHMIGEEILERRKLDETALQPVIQKAAEQVSDTIEPLGAAEIDQICLFLTSAEAEAIVRQIYAAQILDSQEQSLELIRKEFLIAFSLYTDIPEDELENSVTPIFNALIAGCEEALQIAIDQGRLSAHEAKSAFRHRILLDEIAAIQKNLTFLTTRQLPTIEEILEFEVKYRQQVADRHKSITPPYLDAARKLPIDQLYVPPNFVKISVQEDEQSENLAMPNFCWWIYRTVLLGNPGGGKSTFAEKLCYDLATRYSQRLLAGRQVTPILVVLREYGAQKKDHNYSILQFIEATANSRYQVQPPLGAFEYLLLNGCAMVIFDGLDELTDTSDRQEISSDVESFCNLYPSVPVLITSREVGYKEAPLNEGMFDIFGLAPFEDKQVRKYVENWFALDPDLTDSQQQQKVEAFLEESGTVPDLTSNPLMLGLMCNIYRGEGYIPKNRPDVYAKCAEMLFERWDKGRGILVPLPIKEIESQVKPAMMYLANWIYSDKALQGGVTEQKLIEKAADYLCQRRFEDRDEAEQAACEFIRFCRGRAWVFTDTGTTKEGERLYQFTHRTFLEYFTAAYLNRINRTPNKLLEILLPKIAKQEWDVVAQLAFQLQNKHIEEAGDELLCALLEKARETKGDEEWNLLSFATRCLEFIVPSPRVRRDITTACLEHCLAWGSELVKLKKSPERKLKLRIELKPSEILGILLNATTENRVTIADVVEKLLIEKAKNSNETEGIIALEIGLHLALFFTRSTGGRREQIKEEVAYWRSLSERIFEACTQQIKVLSEKSVRLCFDAFWRGQVSIREFIKWHGVENLFRDCNYILTPNTFTYSIASDLVINTLFLLPQPRLVERWENRLHHIEEAGYILLSSPLPWLTMSEHQRYDVEDFLPRANFYKDQLMEENWEKIFTISSSALFGAFTLFAVILEASDEELSIQVAEQMRQMGKSSFNSIYWTFIARFQPAEMDKVQAELDGCGFTPEQQAFAWRWVRQEINLVEWVEWTEQEEGDEPQFSNDWGATVYQSTPYQR